MSAMTPPALYGDRILVEQRLLAAMLAWPLAWPDPFPLEPHHFTASSHGELFVALQKLGPALLDFPLDYRTVAQVTEALDAEMAHLFRSVDGIEAYVDQVMWTETLACEIPALVATVLRCPRCGK